MVMFKARFKPMAADKPSASAGARLHQLQKQQQQQPQPQPTPQPAPQEEDEKAPPIEKEQGPQAPVKLPGPPAEPQRVE